MGNGNPNVIKLNNQISQISLPPIMRAVTAADATASPLNILAGDATKIYIIHGYRFNVTNIDAGDLCTACAIHYTDYWTGMDITLDNVRLTSGVYSNGLSNQSGLNVPTMPGTPVYISCDAIPGGKQATLFFTEVDI